MRVPRLWSEVAVTSLVNEKGAILHLNGRQIGLIADLDLSGMAISLP
jgi:hypothetical protein